MNKDELELNVDGEAEELEITEEGSSFDSSTTTSSFQNEPTNSYDNDDDYDNSIEELDDDNFIEESDDDDSIEYLDDDELIYDNEEYDNDDESITDNEEYGNEIPDSSEENNAIQNNDESSNDNSKEEESKKDNIEESNNSEKETKADSSSDSSNQDKNPNDSNKENNKQNNNQQQNPQEQKTPQNQPPSPSENKQQNNNQKPPVDRSENLQNQKNNAKNSLNNGNKDNDLSKKLNNNKQPRNMSKENARAREDKEKNPEQSKDDDKKKQFDDAKKKVAKEVVKGYAQAHGMDAQTAELVANAALKAHEMETKLKKYLLIGGIVAAFLFLLSIITILTGGEGGENVDTETKNSYLYGAGSEEELYSYLSGRGYCDESSCSSSQAATFYKELKSVLKSNSNLTQQEAEIFITKFIFYERDEDTMFATPEEIQYIADIIASDGKFDIYDTDKYKESFTGESGYFSTYRQDLLEEDDSEEYKAKLYDKIVSKAISSSESVEKYEGSVYRNYGCTQITVTGENAGTYDLEDYIARVVSQENDWAPNGNLENNKAQAVAARTYAIRRTQNCTVSIENSTSAQTIASTASQTAIDATNAVASEVLVDEKGNYISTEYDAFCLASSDDNNYYLTQKNLAIPKTWAAEQGIPQTYLSNTCGTDGDGGHGRGMSQWGSRYLATQGYTYDKILSTFYDNAKITKLGAYSSGMTTTSTGFQKRVNRALRDNQYFYGDGATNEGECAWYAVRRTNEILASVGKTTRVTSGGNGADFCYAADYAQFKKVYEVSELKPGMAISWGSDVSIAGHSYGHVAIIEDVYYDASGNVESIDISEGSNRSGTGYGKVLNGTVIDNDYLWETNLSYETVRTARQFMCEDSLSGSTGSGCQKFSNVPASQIKDRWYGYSFNCAIDLLS